MSKDFRKLTIGAGEGGDWGWRCPKVGSYYDGVIYRCKRDGQKFKAMVGA